jgi:hypothetical protein
MSPRPPALSLALAAALVAGTARAQDADTTNAGIVANAGDLELAGRPLSGFPHFQFVQTFHEGETLSVAVDPALHPTIAGALADIYVVADKSAIEWTQSPALVDVRGAPTAASFGMSGLVSCTVAVDLGTLSGDAGAGFGVPYDLVVDVDLDGVFGQGDFIDGRADAGFYVARDPTLAGPLAVTEILYSGGTFLGQDTYYPTSIGTMGELPVVIVSHGNGHDYRWYDHIGLHLASYGYVVMSHQNDTVPGVETASTTTLTNTDYLLANQAVIGGGALNGHLDRHRIVFIGHSRGGEGVVRAYNRVFTGAYVPTQFVASDVVLVSSIAPVTFLTSLESTPQAVNFHLMYGASDSDVTGSAASTTSKPFAYYERALGDKLVTYIQGAGHADFHTEPTFCWCTGPSLIGKPATHQVVRGTYLPLLELFVRKNRAARDYLTRMYGNFHAPGIPANVIVAQEYRDALSAGNFVIDDFQANSSTGRSSSGGSVMSNASNVVEGRMVDNDNSFDFNSTVPHNGMTNSKDAGEQPQCVVLDWSVGQNVFYEEELVPGMRDLSDDGWLSFRAAQGTRHPETDGLDAPLTFTVTLRDRHGVSSSIPVANYGAFTRTYKRTGSGSGAGWANEWSSVRLRLADFAADGVGLDLSNVVAVRFEFGAVSGSPRGRIGLDDIEIVKR